MKQSPVAQFSIEISLCIIGGGTTGATGAIAPLKIILGGLSPPKVQACLRLYVKYCDTHEIVIEKNILVIVVNIFACVLTLHITSYFVIHIK